MSPDFINTSQLLWHRDRCPTTLIEVFGSRRRISGNMQRYVVFGLRFGLLTHFGGIGSPNFFFHLQCIQKIILSEAHIEQMKTAYRIQGPNIKLSFGRSPFHHLVCREGYLVTTVYTRSSQAIQKEKIFYKYNTSTIQDTKINIYNGLHNCESSACQ